MVREDPDTPKPTQESDIQAVLEQALNGCSESEAQILELCRDYLLAVANRDIESDLRPKLAASDAVQETLIRARTALPDFRGTTEAELLSWLRVILQNNLKDARRKFFEAKKRKAAREQPVTGDAIHSPQPTASAIIGAGEEAHRLQVALAKLPDDYRQVVELRNWQLLAFEEIGERMNRSADAARKLWSRALRMLQDELGD